MTGATALPPGSPLAGSHDDSPLWPTAREWRWLLLLLIIGMVLRLVLIVALRTYRVPPKDSHIVFAGEYGRIARSLALGKGYASPFYHDRGGPTTKGCPLFPLYLSLAFRVFGVYSQGAAWALHIGNSLALLATTALVFVLGKRLFTPAVAWTAAVVFAFDPRVVWFSVNCLWESALSCLAMTALVVLFLWFRGHLTLAAGLLVGVVVGIAAHLHICALPVAATCSLWLFVRARGERARAARAIAAAALATALAIAPWSLRNSLIEGRVVVLRGHLKTYVAWSSSGRTGDEIIAKYRQAWRDQEHLGEREYIEREARLVEGGDPPSLAGFAQGVLRRSLRFWVGELWNKDIWVGAANISPTPAMHYVRLALHAAPFLAGVVGFVIAWRLRWDAWLLLAQMAGFFPPYALLHCRLTRYRFPIHASLILLSSVAVCAVCASLRRRFAACCQRRGDGGEGAQNARGGGHGR